MTKGRRPAGICGAALLLAARMNNFRRSVEEVVQVVKIADSTVRKRLEEFKGTRSGELTVADFRSVWLEEEMDPPAFVKGKEKEREEAEAAEEGVTSVDKKGKRKAGSKKKKKRKRGEEIEEEEAQEEAAAQELENALLPRQAIDPALLNEGILAGAVDPHLPLFLPANSAVDPNIDPFLLPPHQPLQSMSPIPNPISSLDMPPTDAIDETANIVLTEEVADFLQNTQGAMLASALDDAELRRQAQFTVVDELLGLNEDELDQFILTEDEVKIKERVWVELNREYLEAIAAKGEHTESGGPNPKSRKRRKTSNKPRDSSTPSGSTAAESVRNLIKKNPKYSKRINYDALKGLFVDMEDDKDKDNLYTIDQPGGGEGMEVIEEEGGAVGVGTGGERAQGGGGEEDIDGNLEDVDADGEDEGSEKGDEVIDTGWEDVYEQEV